MLLARLKDACDVDVAPRSKITSAISTKFRPVLDFISSYLHHFPPSSLFLSLPSQSPLLTFRISPSPTLTRKNRLYSALKTLTPSWNYERATVFTTTFSTVYRFRPNSRGENRYISIWLVCLFSGGGQPMSVELRHLSDRLSVRCMTDKWILSIWWNANCQGKNQVPCSPPQIPQGIKIDALRSLCNVRTWPTSDTKTQSSTTTLWKPPRLVVSYVNDDVTWWGYTTFVIEWMSMDHW